MRDSDAWTLAIERIRQFEEVATDDDRNRPLFPVTMFEALAASTGLAPGSRVVEIGSGTGRATLPLAERGYVAQRRAG